VVLLWYINYTGATLKCHAGLSPAPQPLIVTEVPTNASEGAEAAASAAVCASYRFRCTAGQGDCTAEEIAKQDVFKWLYAPMMAANCEQISNMEASDKYRNVTCCADELCNKPDPVADPDAHFLNPGGDVPVPCDNQISAAGGLVVPKLMRGSWSAVVLAVAMGGLALVG
jgi:hypothetical protein